MIQPPTAFRQQDLFGGHGEVIIWDLLGAAAIAPFTAALACELAPGGRVGEHVQQQDPEIVIVQAGAARIEVDGTAHEAGPGALIPLALGQRLAITNLSSTAPLNYLIVKARP